MIYDKFHYLVPTPAHRATHRHVGVMMTHINVLIVEIGGQGVQNNNLKVSIQKHLS